jgi:diguanylate cyclase (GGDEF)-like protein/PAS domain S-box-containing protein
LVSKSDDRSLQTWSNVTIRRPSLPDLPVLAGLLAGSIGTLVLIGLSFHMPSLATMVPNSAPMKPNTAIALVLIGMAMVILGRSAGSSRSRHVGIGLAVMVSVIGGLTILEYLTGRSLGIDGLVFSSTDAGGSSARMAPMTALNVLLLGSAAAAAGLGIGRRAVITTAAVAIFVAVLNLFMFAFAAAPPAILAGNVAMAAPTAVAMTAIGLGVIGLLGSASPLAPLAGRTSTAVVSRRLLAVSVTAPVAVEWLRLQGERLQFFDTEFGTSVVLVGTMAIILIAILWSARWATDLDIRRARAEIERDSFFEMSLDMLVVMGREGTFHRVNRAWVATFGYPASEVEGRPWSDFIHPDDRERTIIEAQRNLVVGEDAVGFANRYRCSDGTYRWLEWMSQVGPDGSAAFAVARDVTARHEADSKAERQTQALRARNEDLAEEAYRDTLTGLHNRRFFEGAVPRLERSWRRRSVTKRPQVAVIVFDLDHFGDVNKLHGHQVGDQALREFGSILRDRFRASDLVVRYGGEEFVAVIADASATDALRIAESVRATFEAITIEAPSGAIRVTVSGGVVQLGEELLVAAGIALADVWLSQAKRAGRNQIVGG